MNVLKEDFDSLLLGAIKVSLVQVFGENAARSVNFYIDPNIAVANAENYARSLEKLFGVGAKLVLENIMVTLSEKTGVVRTGSMSFGDTVTKVRLSFQKSD